MSNEPENAAGDRLPSTGADWATGAQVVAIIAGILAMACGLLMLRDVGDTLAFYGSSASPVTVWGGWLCLAPAGAGVLAAIAVLRLKGRARWLPYPQIGLGLLAQASSVYIAYKAAPVTGPEPLYGAFAVGVVPEVIAVALLTQALRRPAKWHGAFVLAAVAAPCLVVTCTGPAYGPGSGTLIGIVARCPSAAPAPAQLATVSAQNQANRIVASQSLPLKASGARYRLRLPAGAYSISVVTRPDSSSTYDNGVTVTAHEETEENFNSGECMG